MCRCVPFCTGWLLNEPVNTQSLNSKKWLHSARTTRTNHSTHRLTHRSPLITKTAKFVQNIREPWYRWRCVWHCSDDGARTQNICVSKCRPSNGTTMTGKSGKNAVKDEDAKIEGFARTRLKRRWQNSSFWVGLEKASGQQYFPQIHEGLFACNRPKQNRIVAAHLLLDLIKQSHNKAKKTRESFATM